MEPMNSDESDGQNNDGNAANARDTPEPAEGTPQRAPTPEISPALMSVFQKCGIVAAMTRTNRTMTSPPLTSSALASSGENLVSSSGSQDLYGHRPTKSSPMSSGASSSSTSSPSFIDPRRHPPETIAALRAAFAKNKYVDRIQKAQLVEEFGLTPKQVADWFSYARRRGLQKKAMDKNTDNQRDDSSS